MVVIKILNSDTVQVWISQSGYFHQWTLAPWLHQVWSTPAVQGGGPLAGRLWSPEATRGVETRRALVAGGSQVARGSGRELFPYFTAKVTVLVGTDCISFLFII